VQQRLAAGDRHHRRAALVDCVQRIRNIHAPFVTFRCLW
jgi:hypothetical protein